MTPRDFLNVKLRYVMSV